MLLRNVVVSHAPEFFEDFVLVPPDVARNIEAPWFRGTASARKRPAVRRLRFDVHDLAHLAVSVPAVPDPDPGQRYAIAVAGIAHAGNTRAQEIVIPEVLNDVGNDTQPPVGASLSRKTAQPVFDEAKAVQRPGQERQ